MNTHPALSDATTTTATTVTEDHQRHRLGHKQIIAISIAYDLCVKYQIVVAIHLSKEGLGEHNLTKKNLRCSSQIYIKEISI